MSGYIKYFENSSKNMSFKIEDEDVYLCMFVCMYVYDDKYIKTKVKTFNNTINTLFSEDKISKERIHYVCISGICIDSILRVDKKNYSQIYLEQYKYKIKKRELVSLIDDEVDLSSNNSDDSDYLDE